MHRRVLPVALLAVLAMPAAVQVQSGWKVRTDGGHGASAPDAVPGLTFAAADKGFRVAGGPGGIVFDPAYTARGVYSVRATFTLLKPSATVTDYGLFFGGADLEGAAPTYVYFTIAHDGAFQLRHRAGAEVHEIDKSLHFAIRRPDASGKSTNTLEVQVAPTAVSYLINGAVVHATPTRAGTGSYTEGEKAYGIAGVRVDGPVDVQVEGFEVNTKFVPPVRGQ
ncbi:MAG: hypothetical protein HYU37_14760 [Acidobacteria bacterium]|nr:hypothetical protein [Acidobacteriota bacterium]